MVSADIERLIGLLAKLPGLGPRSARRAVLHLVKRRESLAQPLAKAMAETLDNIKTCSRCGNLDSQDPCALCRDPKRDGSVICVVEDVADLWALERSAAFRGHYHVLGGTLSAIDGIGPEDLNRIFDPFYSTKQVGGPDGMGLGLSISYGLVQSFGGTIRGSNAPGGGAVFTVELDQWREAQEAAA